MELRIAEPSLYDRDCNDCRLYYIGEDGNIEKRGDKKLRRPAGSGPPCEMKCGCPKGHYDNQKVLNQNNLEALSHYLQCKAIGKFPDDPIVSENALRIHLILKKYSVEI